MSSYLATAIKADRKSDKGIYGTRITDCNFYQIKKLIMTYT